MARRKQGNFDFVASLPWPIGVVLGIVAFLVIRYGVGAYLLRAGGPLLHGAGERIANGALAPLAWLALFACWAAAAASFVSGRQRRRLLEIQSDLSSIAALSWREFEMLVGEAYRRRGYDVVENGLGGADGGIDLFVRKAGETRLVQCKRWRTQQINVQAVREMWGLVNHHRANGAMIVCVGHFTRDAAQFAAGKPIELINGKHLLDLIRSVQTSTSTALPTPSVTASEGTPACPKCGGEMAVRRNRNSGQNFWGCVEFPRCRGTREQA